MREGFVGTTGLTPEDRVKRHRSTPCAPSRLDHRALERELAGVSVRVGGQDAPLFFVGPGQINAQMPFEVSPGDSVPVAVSAGGLLTAPQNYLIASVQPGIFDIGGGQGVVLIANTDILVAPVGSIPGR